MERVVGVESAHGFGDCLFNIPLIKALAAKYGSPVGVAVEAQCADAYLNVPEIAEIIYIPQMRHGLPKLQSLGYQHVFQITQNEKFFEFRQHDPNHSLIDTARITGQQLGVTFDPRPQIALTDRELHLGLHLPSDKPIIIVESVYKSAQSWATTQAFTSIVNKHRHTHTIIWASNSGAPPGTLNMLNHSRREIIGCLHRCERFYSVGSGFFCASLALPVHLQPPEIVCLWLDDFYHYERPLDEHRWHSNIKWVHNHQELDAVL